MVPRPANVPLRRMVVLAWTALWMLAVPLLHVHPEVEHSHGKPGHVHRTVTHAVFSPDLGCEYAAPVHVSTCPDADHQHLQARAHSGHAFNHPEIAFSLLNGPNDRSLGKPGVTVSSVPAVRTLQAERAVSTASSSPVIVPTVLFLSTGLPLRGPPSPSI